MDSDFPSVGLNPAVSTGMDTPPAPPPQNIPSVGAEPAPAPQPQDPRLAAVMARLNPPPQPVSPWAEALRKILPMIGALGAMHSNAGGAFANEWQNIDKQRQQGALEQSKSDLELATILHQQETERLAAQKMEQAQKALDVKAQREEQQKQEAAERARLKDIEAGPVLEHANEIAAKEGKDAADKYLSGYAGLNGTLKDLVDKYAYRDNTGAIALGKQKTPIEAKAGTEQEYVERARRIMMQKLGRPLTDDEAQTLDDKVITHYHSLKPTDDAGKALDRAIKEARLESLRQTMEEKYKSLYSNVQILQGPNGQLQPWGVNKKTSKFEMIGTTPPPGSTTPAIPAGTTRPQPPGFLDKLGSMFGGSSDPNNHPGMPDFTPE